MVVSGLLAGGCGENDDNGEGGGGSAGAGRGGAGGQGGVNAAGQGGAVGGAGGQGAGANGQGSASGGGLDPAFGERGLLFVEGFPLPSDPEELSADPQDVTVGPDGAIYALGGFPDAVVVRLSADGIADPAFGRQGVAKLEVAQLSALAVQLQPDGKIVVAGSTPDAGFASRPTFVRLNPDGSRDGTFGDGGVAVVEGLPFRASPFSLALQGDRIIAAGPSGPRDGDSLEVDGFVLRLGPDGALDPTFAAPKGYHVYHSSDGSEDVIEDWFVEVSVRADGAIVVGGYGGDPTRAAAERDSDLLVALYGADGTPAASFGRSGVVYLDHAPAAHPDYRDNVLTAMAVEPGGKVVLVGSSANGVDSDASVVRLSPDGSLDPSFGQNGTLDLDLDGGDLPVDLVTLADGSLVLATSVDGPEPERLKRPALVALGPGGALEPSFGENGVLRIDAGGADVAGFYARTLDRQPDGKLIVGCYSALAGTNRPMLARVNPR
ncbi:MAG TPA: hypothetical protein VFS43_27540 [Polyangiaceae bacterium]|nr:hypothetical protein [Polyangiaceae bacterium]